MPIISSLQKSGVTSRRGIANALNCLAIRTARGCDCQVFSVRNLIARTPAAFVNEPFVVGKNHPLRLTNRRQR